MGDGRRTRRRAGRRLLFSLLAVVTAATATLVGGVAVAVDLDPDPRSITVLPRLRAVTPPGQQHGHLVSASTGSPFQPRGANYVRLTDDPVLGYAYHSTFEPGRYTAAEADSVLSTLRRDRHNTVRVFIDQGNPTDADVHGRPHGMSRGVDHDEPLYGPYMDNVADFVRRAADAGIRVMFSLDHVPYNAYYLRIIGHIDRAAVNMDGRNLEYLHPSYAEAKATYLANFVRGLEERGGERVLSAVLAYQTDNEAYLVANKAPYNRMAGTVTTQDGLTYDMSDPVQRQQSADANFVFYANRMVDAIKRVDPQALVTMGMFTFGAVYQSGPGGMPVYCERDCPAGEYRSPARPRSLSHWSRLDFLDIHIYPAHKPGINNPYTLARNLQTIEWQHVEGVVILGEFGAAKAFYQNSITRAAEGMREMQIETCRAGFSGWLFWTFDTAETAEQRLFYNLAEQGGAINAQLAPTARPFPCVASGSRPPVPPG